MRIFSWVSGEAGPSGRVGPEFSSARKAGWRAGPASRMLAALALAVLLAAVAIPVRAQGTSAQTAARGKAAPQRTRLASSLGSNLPPKVIQAQRFLAERGWAPGSRRGRTGAGRGGLQQAGSRANAVGQQTQSAATATWQPLGPTAVVTPNFGLVTGRVSALAFDPADSTGNRLYLGTTGGGVWVAQNAGVGNPASVVFNPLTDTVAALSGVTDASISIGALTVQPGGTGVILAGTGDPNDALDSYYGAGILRSADGGNTWGLITSTKLADPPVWSFAGEGFAGFAWSTINPQLVVAAVSQAYEGTLVNALLPGRSYEGLYYSDNADFLGVGVSWRLATITDGGGADVQGPNDAPALPDGNAATSVVWNPVRKLFIAAVRFHGYYQSLDGITWTRLAAQPGTGLTTTFCPTNYASTGSIDCPIFRGTLAVNPETGDTFAWTTDAYNQDQGLWQDSCAIVTSASGSVCGNQNITFARQWNTTALDTSTNDGAATIENGDYTLALAAVPAGLGQGQDTLLLAGADDLWKCSLAMGCVWRNTTNATTCMSAQVAEYQHTLAWSTANPLEIFVGNDSGLWRSTDAIGETGLVCAATDANHFQNLNGSLGSLAEVVSMSASENTPYTMMAGLGVNGTAGATSASGVTTDWPQILGGEGGPVVIDPQDNTNWYVNDEAGVSIYFCNETQPCTPASFGLSALITDADVGGDGTTMATPAPFLVDPLDTSQFLIGTCRVWRGPIDGVGWSGANAISPILDSGASDVSCSGDSLIRSMAALVVPGGGEVVYVGMYGSLDGGGTRAGHVLSANVNPAKSGAPVWQDLTLNPVTNDSNAMNAYGFDISSITIDPHDATGNTIYATIAGAANSTEAVKTVYRSIDGGTTWASIVSNLPFAPVNSLAVDPQNANTVYLATDAGVYFTTQMSGCMNPSSNCWSEFGSGLPGAPVVELSASPVTSSAQVLVAATYGRGIWQTGLWTGGTSLTTAVASPSPLIFPTPVPVASSSTLTVTLTNTGSIALTPTPSLTSASDFTVTTDNCQGTTVQPGGNCTILVTFAPTATGSRTGQLTIFANVSGGQLTVELSGTGVAAGVVTLSPATISFDSTPGQTSLLPPVEVGATSGLFQVEAGNSGSAPVSITGISITTPFIIYSNSCGTSTLAPLQSCQMQLEFAPTLEGAIAGTLTLIDGAGTQTVALTGFGWAAATDSLPATALSFGNVAVGQLSTAQTIPLSNSGDLPLTGIVVSVSGPFQIQGSSNACGAQLTGSSSCSISVVFAPTQLGSQTGTLTVADITRTQPQTVALNGTGVQPGAISVTPSSLTFAGQQVGLASSPLTLTVTNTGGAPMANLGFAISGSQASFFTTGATTCPTTNGATLNAGSSCTVPVIFTPETTGGSAASLVVSSSSAGVTQVTVPLNGTGQIQSGLNVSPAQLSFGVVSIGQSSAAQTVNLTNTSTYAATGLTLGVTGQTVPPPFSLTQSTCGGSLAAGASCSVGVIFAPAVTGATTGVLTFSSASVTTPATVLLSGTGAVGAAIAVTPGAIVFPTTGVNLISTQTPVTVTNTGVSQSLSNLTLAVSAGFVLVNNTCGTTLGPGSSCTAAVEFAPTSDGAQAGSLTVTSSTVTTGASVALSGMALDFTLTVSGSATQTISAGQTASYTLVITPLNSSQGTFAFQCGTLPTNAVCIFNPVTETLGPGVVGNVIVEISTGAVASVRRPVPVGWRLLPLVCGLVLLPLGWRRRRKVLLLAALLSILAAGVSSCTGSGGGSGGSSGGSGGTGSTPAGTYSISASADSSGVEHSVLLTLTVD